MILYLPLSRLAPYHVGLTSGGNSASDHEEHTTEDFSMLVKNSRVTETTSKRSQPEKDDPLSFGKVYLRPFWHSKKCQLVFSGSKQFVGKFAWKVFLSYQFLKEVFYSLKLSGPSVFSYEGRIAQSFLAEKNVLRPSLIITKKSETFL